MTERFTIEQTALIGDFERQLLQRAADEQQRLGHIRGPWNQLVQLYIRQKAILEVFPFPDWLEEEKSTLEDEVIPSIKHITENIDPQYEYFYRWGFKRKGTPNYRVIYAIEDFWKVILLYPFEKSYNGSIRKEDIEKAVWQYQRYQLLQ